MGFDKLKSKLASKGAENPGGLARSIGEKKYGKEKFAKAAEEGKSMKGMKPKKKGSAPAKKGSPVAKGKPTKKSSILPKKGNKNPLQANQPSNLPPQLPMF